MAKLLLIKQLIIKQKLINYLTNYSGVMFGWVEGTYPSGDTRVVIQFESYLNLLNYTHWTSLNDQYFSKVDTNDHH